VATIALEVPYSCFASPDGILNTWSITRKLFHSANDTNGLSHLTGVQTSRLGNPLVNELVVGLVDKVRFNRQTPRLDADPNLGFANYVLYPTFSKIISLRYLAAVNQILGASFPTLEPAVPRNDLVAIFLTGIPGVTQGQGKFYWRSDEIKYWYCSSCLWIAKSFGYCWTIPFTACGWCERFGWIS